VRDNAVSKNDVDYRRSYSSTQADFIFVPACTNTQVKPAMAQDINRTCHFGKENFPIPAEA